MKRMLFGLLAAALVAVPSYGDDEKPKRKMPKSAKYFTKLKDAKKDAARYDAPIFVVAVGKGSPAEDAVKDLTRNKFFRELAQKGFFVYTMRVNLSKKEKDVDGRSPRPLYEKLTKDDQALLDLICPADKVRKLPVFGMVSPDAKEVKIKPVDMPRPPRPGSEYIGQYLQGLQSAAQAYGIDIEMSKALVKYIENPPEEKKKK